MTSLPQFPLDPADLHSDRLETINDIVDILDHTLGKLWRSVEIWDLAHRLASDDSHLPAEMRMDLQQLLAAAGHLEEDLHGIEASYQMLRDVLDPPDPGAASPRAA